jgi:hypothetical protein
MLNLQQLEGPVDFALISASLLPASPEKLSILKELPVILSRQKDSVNDLALDILTLLLPYVSLEAAGAKEGAFEVFDIFLLHGSAKELVIGIMESLQTLALEVKDIKESAASLNPKIPYQHIIRNFKRIAMEFSFLVEIGFKGRLVY